MKHLKRERVKGIKDFAGHWERGGSERAVCAPGHMA